MNLRNAILVVLLEQEGSGYEIAKQFDGTLGNFWHATHQQIYKELSKLANDGLVTFTEIVQSDKPTKKVYCVTPTGRSALIEWMRQPTEPCVVKEPLLVKLFAGYLLDPGEMADEMKRQRERHHEQLSGYLQIEKEHFADIETLSREHQFGYFTLRSGIHYERGWLKWADEVLRELKKEG